MGFFWKGDEALSEEFKKWISQRILGAKLTVPEISSLEPLGRVFDFIYGRRYFSLTTFLRVAAISIVALIVVVLATVRIYVTSRTDLSNVKISYPTNLVITLQLLLLFINIFCDYLSITKARLLINRITRLKIRVHVILFVVSDLIVTCCILVLNGMLYTVTTLVMGIDLSKGFADSPTAGSFFLLFGVPLYAFILTTFMTLLLTVLYSLALLCLRVVGVIKKFAGLIQWMLPVQTLPVRSIGMVAGALLFCFLELFHAFAGLPKG
jgi:hypothetical protein